MINFSIWLFNISKSRLLKPNNKVDKTINVFIILQVLVNVVVIHWYQILHSWKQYLASYVHKQHRRIWSTYVDFIFCFIWDHKKGIICESYVTNHMLHIWFTYGSHITLTWKATHMRIMCGETAYVYWGRETSDKIKDWRGQYHCG